MKLDVKFTQSDQAFSTDFGEVHIVTEYVGGELYQGEYKVTPKVEEQTMPTKGKVMSNDVTVNPVPFFNVSNTSGGSTAFIASEI